MRLKYDQETMKKIEDFIRLGLTNNEICEEFGVERGYHALCSKCNAIRRSLSGGSLEGLPNLVKVGSVETKEQDKEVVEEKIVKREVSVASALKECDDVVNSLRNDILLKVSDGFSSTEIKMMESYSKSISKLISRLENIQFMFDNISSIRKD